jgi:hypothetical protein
MMEHTPVTHIAARTGEDQRASTIKSRNTRMKRLAGKALISHCFFVALKRAYLPRRRHFRNQFIAFDLGIQMLQEQASRYA